MSVSSVSQVGNTQGPNESTADAIGKPTMGPLSSAIKKLTDNSYFLGRQVLHLGRGARDYIYPKYVCKKAGGLPEPHRTLDGRKTSYTSLVLLKLRQKPGFRHVVSKWNRVTLMYRPPCVRARVLEQSMSRGELFKPALSALQRRAWGNIERAADAYADNVNRVAGEKLKKMGLNPDEVVKLYNKKLKKLKGDETIDLFKEDFKKLGLKPEHHKQLFRYINSDPNFIGSEYEYCESEINEFLAGLMREFRLKDEGYSHADVIRQKREVRKLMHEITESVIEAAERDEFVDLEKIIRK